MPSLTLVGPTGRHPVPGAVPPGRYQIEARFGGAPTMVCGAVTLAAGAPRRLHADAAFTTCEAR